MKRFVDFALIVGLFVMLPLAGVIGACTAQQGQTAVSTIPQDIALFVCVEQTVSTDVAAHQSWEQCVADSIAHCGATAEVVAQVWSSHNAALVKQGFVPRMMVPVDGGSK